MFQVRPVFLTLASLALLATVATATEYKPNGRAFQPGEKLTYVLKWGAIPAGTATFEVKSIENINGEPSYHLVMTAKTNKVVSAIYKVRDRVDAYVSTRMTHSTLYRKKQQEGKHAKRDIEVTFDWQDKIAQYRNHDHKRPPVTLLPGTFDPLSAFYAYRCNRMEDTDELSIPVTDGKRCVVGKIHKKGSQVIKTKSGTFKTKLVEPVMDGVGGVFKKSKGASLRVWFSDDRRAIPVKFASKVVVGHFTGELIAMEKTLPVTDQLASVKK